MGIETAAIIAGAATAAGGTISGARGQQSNQTNNPIRDPAFAPLQQRLIQDALRNLRNPREVARGVEERGLTSINDTFRLGRQSLDNRLTARGLGSSPVAGRAIGNLENARLGEAGQFRASIPLLEQNLRQQDFMNALQLFGQEPVGNVVRSSVPGGASAGIAQGLGQGGLLTGYLTNQGVFQNKNQQATVPGPVANAQNPNAGTGRGLGDTGLFGPR